MKILSFLILFNSYLALSCNELPHKSLTEARVNNVTFTLNDPIKYCLTLPSGGKGIVEFKTVNLSDTGCGILKMVVITPDKRKLKSTDSQPGAATLYVPGVYRMKYVLKNDDCNKFDLIATWGNK